MDYADKKGKARVCRIAFSGPSECLKKGIRCLQAFLQKEALNLQLGEDVTSLFFHIIVVHNVVQACVIGVPEETQRIEPKLDEIKVSGKLSGTLDEVYNRISGLQIFSTKKEDAQVTAVRVESRDIQKNPYIFYIVQIRADGISVQYSTALGTSEKMRKLTVLKNILNIMSLIVDLFTPDNKELFQYLDSSIEEVVGSISQSYSSLFNNYDSLATEYRNIKRLNIELSASTRTLTVKTAQLSKENDELKAKLEVLEKYSDESLMVMVQDWLDSHNSTIDLEAFAKNYKLSATRVEQILNKMESLGYLELRG